jgi:hypothetical protein
MLRITHNAGFYSCCTIRLEQILEYFRNNKNIPDIVDSSQQFECYKNNKLHDITYDYFAKNDKMIIPYEKDVYITNVDKEQQFSEYNLLNFKDLKQFIEKYFSQSLFVHIVSNNLVNKYCIDTNNTCAIMYRGNDKAWETIQPSYEEMIKKALYIRDKDPNIRFLVQTDELEFLEEFAKHIPNSFHFEELPKIRKRTSSIQFLLPNNEKQYHAVLYNASIRILSKCKYIITTSGNGEMWMILFRGHANGVYQWLRPLKYIYGVHNKSFDETKTNFWIDNE